MAWIEYDQWMSEVVNEKYTRFELTTNGIICYNLNKYTHAVGLLCALHFAEALTVCCVYQTK